MAIKNMRKEFFKTAGILLTIACVAISVILGVRAGMVSESIWAGVRTGGGFLFGTALFALGVGACAKCDYKCPVVATILWGISLLGIAVLGVSLMAMMALDFIPVTMATVKTGLWIGVGMFVGPILLVMAYFCGLSLWAFAKEHRVFSIATIILAVAMGIGYIAIGKGFWVGFAGFLFHWTCICVITYAWNAVKDEGKARLYWRIAMSLALIFFGSGLAFLLSEVLMGVPALHDILLWIAQNVGMYSMYCLLAYAAVWVLLFYGAMIWSKVSSR